MASRDRDSSSRRGTRNRRSRSISRSRSRSRSRSFSSRGGHFRGRAEDEDGNPHFSNYYRDRFGSESPQEYQNLRVTNIDPKVTNDELREALEKYLGRYGDLNVKIIRQMDPHERIAYVNFERVGDARNARHGCLQKLVDLLGRRLTVDPAGVIRDQEGRCVKATSGGTPGARSPPYPPATKESYGFRGNSYRSDRDRDYGRDDRSDDYQRNYRGSGYRGSHASPRDQRNSRQIDRPTSRRANDYNTPPAGGGRGDWFSPRGPVDDSDEEAKATRTLFVGNLHMDVTKTDLQRTFNKYGVIEQIDIKTPHDGAAPYAFIRFQNLAMAQEARHYLVGHCGAWKIGYGKPMPSRRLWVGGLGPNTSLAWIEKEFDRFGAIEKIDYVRGENHAYILFASGEASTEAYTKMKGMQLKDGGERHLLQVDYADSSMYDGGGDDDRGQPNFNHNGGRSQAANRDDVDSGGGDKKSASARRPPSTPPSSKRPMTPPQPPPGSPPLKQKSSKGAAISTARSPRTPPLPAPTTTVSPPPGSPSVQKSTAGAVSGVIISDGTVSSTTTSPPTSLCELSAQNLDELHQLRSPCWTGALVLKKSAYPIRLYKLAGDDDLIDAYLRNERGESVQLTVTQRLKLDQPKQDDVQKWLSSPPDQHAFLLAAANTNALAAQGNLADLQPRPLKLLVKYFKEKDAAGVVSVSSNRRIVPQGPSPPPQQNGILYTFPRCPFADLLTSALCPKLAVMQQCGDDCLLVVLQKSAA